MPEGHTVHRLAQVHQKRFRRQKLSVSSPQGRFVEGADAVNGRVLDRTSAWGKHLFHHYRGGRIVHVHLGLYGKFTDFDVEDGVPEPRGQVRMRMIGTERGADLRGPTACEVLDEAQVSQILDRLGPDPLRPDAEPELAWKRIAKSRRAIGALLMDQKVIAGIGNVYRSELLFRHRIDPHRPGTDIAGAEFEDAWSDLVELMKVGVRRGRIITLRPEDDHYRSKPGSRRARTYVYKHAGDPCRVCDTAIRTEEMEGRNLFWCPHCQS